MTKLTALILMTLSFLIVSPVYANNADTERLPPPANKTTTPLPQVEKNRFTNSQKLPIETATQKETQLQLNKINTDVAFLRAKTKERDWFTPLMNLLSVFFGALSGGLLSYKIQKSRNKFEINRSMMDWKIKQISELYGPLYALLKQSTALYRHMNQVLETTNPEKFKLVECNTSQTKINQEEMDTDNKLFKINKDNRWINFRTVTDIDEVYGKGYGVEKYFDEIIEIGKHIVQIIEDKAGYIRDDQPKLAATFGQYLAHYTILRQLHDEKRKKFEGTPSLAKFKNLPTITVDHSAAFPRRIQHLVEQGYKNLNDDLKRWSTQGARLKQ